MEYSGINGKELNVNIYGDGMQPNNQEIITDEQLFQRYARDHEDKFSLRKYATESVKDACACSRKFKQAPRRQSRKFFFKGHRNNFLEGPCFFANLILTLT